MNKENNKVEQARKLLVQLTLDEICSVDEVLSYVGNIPMYAKKHVCKKCGYEF